MSATRRSARVAAHDTSPDYTEPSESGRKRKSQASGTSPSAKRGRKTKSKENLKEQTTIEDTMDIDKKEEPKPDAAQSNETVSRRENDKKETEHKPEAEVQQGDVSRDKPTDEKSAEEPKPKEQQPIDIFTTASADEPADAPKQEEEKPAEPQPQASEVAPGSEDKPAEPPTQNGDKTADPLASNASANASTEEKKPTETAPATNGDDKAIEPTARKDEVPSSILEKGIIYFFFRPRVNTTSPEDVSDIARSYFVLRPLPHGAALSTGPIPDARNARLIALPKKVLPLSGKDRFMAFVEKSQVSFSDLKSSFMAGSNYVTQTQGTSHSPPVTPLAEGVYAITSSGRDSHLAYMTTIPSYLSEVQRDIGLRDSGSFVVSVKNPKFPGPANTNIGKDPGYSDEIKQEFRELRWMPLKPSLLDYEGCQFLLIGESSGLDGGAVEGREKDEREGKEGVKEEMEKLEGEDELRVEALKGDDAIFADLGISKKEYPPVPSTW